MKVEMQCIYVKDDVLFFHLWVENSSVINYSIDQLRFFVADKKKGKRTAVQETDCKPIYVAGNTSDVKANSSISMVLAMEKFTIPDAKYLCVQLYEKSGGRNLGFKISNRKLMKAKLIK